MGNQTLQLIATAFTPEQFPPMTETEIVIAGRSNVGKSSLINALAGFAHTAAGNKSAARVSQKPGCTRSVNFYRLWPGVRFVDLPGFGFAHWPDALRRKLAKLIEDYLADRKNLACLVHVVDARLPLQKIDWTMLEWIKHFNYPYLLTLNKCDKLSRSFIQQRCLEIKREISGSAPMPEIIPVSALTGDGLPGLKAAVRLQIEKLRQNLV